MLENVVGLAVCPRCPKEQRQLNGGQLPTSLRIVIDAVDGPHVSSTAHTATVERKQ